MICYERFIGDEKQETEFFKHSDLSDPTYGDGLWRLAHRDDQDHGLQLLTLVQPLGFSASEIYTP